MTRPTLSNDCFASDRPRLAHGEAIEILSSGIVPITGTTTIPLSEAVGRVLATAAVARHPVPMHTNSAVDGFAFRHADYQDHEDGTWPVAGLASAGHPFSGRPPAGAAVRIFTGAVMPEALDTVVMQEDTAAAPGDGERVLIPAGLRPGSNVRKAGEDVAKGVALLDAGSVLRPQDLAALASIGYASVPVHDRVKVAIVSSGDEVIRPGDRELALGEVYDANAPMLTALAAAAGGEVSDLGVWPDNRGEVQRRLEDAASRFDLILTTGGASKGAEDHMAAALGALGRRHVWQLAIKPGRPMMFGQISNGGSGKGANRRDVLMVGLPGNPVAVFVCFLMYVYPLLRRLGGAPWPEPHRFMLPAAFSFTGRKPGRREFWRGILQQTPNGLAAGKFPRDGSGLISGLRAADGLIDIPEDTADVHPGDPVAFIPFSEFGILGR